LISRKAISGHEVLSKGIKRDEHEQSAKNHKTITLRIETNWKELSIMRNKAREPKIYGKDQE
jgi:hypothetical protein